MCKLFVCLSGIARSHSEALVLVKKKRPGLILADIGSLGFEAVNDLLTSFEAFEAPVVLITAFPERFLTGERAEPVFLE